MHDANENFSQLRLHGGTNHLLGMPTGLLQRWMAGGDALSALSGGVVRVEAFRSGLAPVDWVGQGFAEHLPASTLAMLRDAGVPSRYVQVPYYAAGSAGLPIVSRPAQFLPHSLSALGFRRLLARARAIGLPFTIQYTRMESPAEGNETWRQAAGDARYRLSEDPRIGYRSCSDRSKPRFVVWAAGACGEREVALIEEPSRHVWMTHWLMPMPNPIVEPVGEMHCVSIS